MNFIKSNKNLNKTLLIQSIKIMNYLLLFKNKINILLIIKNK